MAQLIIQISNDKYINQFNLAINLCSQACDEHKSLPLSSCRPFLALVCTLQLAPLKKLQFSWHWSTVNILAMYDLWALLDSHGGAQGGGDGDANPGWKLALDLIYAMCIVHFNIGTHTLGATLQFVFGMLYAVHCIIGTHTLVENWHTAFCMLHIVLLGRNFLVVNWLFIFHFTLCALHSAYCALRIQIDVLNLVHIYRTAKITQLILKIALIILILVWLTSSWRERKSDVGF